LTRESLRASSFAQGVFAVLVVATVGAFFLAQRVKSTPAAIARYSMRSFCSPNGDGRFDGCRLSFLLKRADDVTVRVVGPDGDAVRTLVSDRTLAAFRRLRVRWDGRTSDGAHARDGAYRFQVSLRRQGRSILVPRSLTLDTTPPRPVVSSIGPKATEVMVYRTAPSPSPEPVVRLQTLHGSGTVSWDGTVNGRRVRPGTYVVAVRTQDRAGNIGSSPAVLPPSPGYGQTMPGHGGITIRYLGVQPPLDVPAVTGERVTFGVDARRAQ
jgi:hypothetical protein